MKSILESWSLLLGGTGGPVSGAPLGFLLFGMALCYVVSFTTMAAKWELTPRKWNSWPSTAPFINLVIATIAMLLVTTSGVASAGIWEDEFPITQDPIFQYRSYITTAPDDTLYVLYPDWTDWEDTRVYLIRSADYGDTWTEPALLAEGTAYDDFQIHADAAGVHVLLVEWIVYNKRVFV